MTYADALAKRLLDICRERNISVNKLANLSGVTQSTIRDITTGESKNPKLKTLHKIAIGLGMTLSELLDFPELNETLFDDEQ